MTGTADARNAHHRGTRNEEVRAVRQIAAFHIVDVCAHERGDLLEFGRFVQFHFKNFPCSFFGKRGDENAFRIPVQADVAHVARTRRVDQVAQFVRFQVKDLDRIVVGTLAARTVRHPVRFKVRAGSDAEEHFFRKVRVREQCFTAEHKETLGDLHDLFAGIRGRRIDRGEFRFVFLQFFQIFFSRVFVRELFFQILDRHAE